MSKKYTLLRGDTIRRGGQKLYRIKAVKSFGSVKKGDLGGYIATEENLSQEGAAWVYGDAQVYGRAWVYGNAMVFGDAQVWGNAQVYVNARVYGNAKVYGNARVSGDAEVYGNARVSGDAEVYGNAWVYGDAQVWGNAQVYGNAKVYGNARVSGDAEVYDNTLNVCNDELYQYNITLTAYHIQIGCVQMLFPEWLEVGIEDANRMGLKRKYYKPIKELLRTIIPHYYGE
jgi:carbonic anhydrase/acetyltransferase-like protein (isoleucine patch superfamily)